MSGSRPFDVICVGRAAVDLYGEQIGGRPRICCVRQIHGSPPTRHRGARPATGDTTRGRRATVVCSRDARGRGVDVSHVVIRPRHLTALAIPGIPTATRFVAFYRE
jgi:5-dehydro-2-deoxygluconokinase